MFTFKKITDRQQLETYNRQYKKMCGVPFEMAYLRKTGVSVAYDPHGDRVGGILFSHPHYYRPIELIQNLAIQQALQQQLAEKIKIYSGRAGGTQITEVA